MKVPGSAAFQAAKGNVNPSLSVSSPPPPITGLPPSALAQHNRHYNYEVGGLLAFGALLDIVQHVNSGRPWYTLAIELSAMAIVALSYFFIGIPGWKAGNRTQVMVSIAINIAAVGLSMTQGVVNGFLPIVVLVDLWSSLTRKRDRTIATILLALVTLLGIAYISGWNLSQFRQQAPQVMLFLVISLGGAIWMSRSYEISRSNAQLVDELRQAQEQIGALQYAAGETAERERMASEIHDTLAQGFNSIVMQIQATNIALERGNLTAIPERLAIMETVAQENLAEARGLVAAHAPVPLQDSSLEQALHRLGDRWAKETGIRVTVTTDDHQIPTTAQEVVLLRAAQEALTNVRKHADASAVELVLASQPGGGIRLIITDDGRGASDAVTEGFGLAGMRERVETAGGVLQVESRDGFGTQVQVTFPAEP